MSYNSESGERDYRGRGKRAAENYRGKHFKASDPSSDEGLVPIGNTAVEARVGQHDKKPEPAPEFDPFAPSEEPVTTPARAAAESDVEPDIADAAAQAQGTPKAPAADSDAAEAPDAYEPPSHAVRFVPEPDRGPADEAADEPSAQHSEEAEKYNRGDERYTKHKPGFSRGQKILVTVVAVVAAVVFAALGVGYAFWQDTQNSIALSDQTIKDELTPTVSNEKPYWVLIMGSDSRSTDTTGTRSDVVMLARIDEPNKQVTLVSIPRDTYVTINGSPQKINAAYSIGGAKQMINTVEDFAGIKISHYAEIYFKGFSKLVDEIGGVDVVVPETGSYHGVTIKKGKQHLNGKEALTFARIRKSYATGDFRRTECQRILVKALAKKILSQDITQIPSTIAAASECFSTDMSLEEVANIATYMKGMDTDDIYSAMTPSTTGMIDGVSYTFTYNNQWILMMQKASNGEKPKLTKKEIAICGYQSTPDYPLDMSAGLPQDIQTQLQEYWNQQKAKKYGTSDSSSSSDSSSGSMSSSDSSESSDSSN